MHLLARGWLALALALAGGAAAFWDIGTTTPEPPPDPEESEMRLSRWTWEWADTPKLGWWWIREPETEEMKDRRSTHYACGLTIEFLNIATCWILNRRVVLSSANPLEPYMEREDELRIWAQGMQKNCFSPYRYRVWRVRRVLPRSVNPEHAHGPRGRHVPRHDLAVITSMDQIFVTVWLQFHGCYPARAMLPNKHQTLRQKLLIIGSGYKSRDHIYGNFRIQHTIVSKDDIVDCSRYLPKWWGKFICLRNLNGEAGTPSGGGLVDWGNLMGVGSFEIRYNEERVHVFTDVRYYVDLIKLLANFTWGEYYEYAYVEWFIPVFYKRWENNIEKHHPVIMFQKHGEDYDVVAPLSDQTPLG